MSRHRSMYATRGKRVLDVGVGLTLCIATGPVQLAIAVLVRKKLGSPVLFKQLRPGLDGKPFEIVKFRTMTDARGPDGTTLSDDERLTSFGRFLRSTSLDELPELMNVVRGEMSLVGPRPLLMSYLPRYSPEQMRRHEVRPGLTGLAQVHGRNSQSWDRRFELDIEYVDRISFGLDIKILGRTIWKVLSRSDIVASGHASYPEFKPGATAHGSKHWKAT